MCLRLPPPFIHPPQNHASYAQVPFKVLDAPGIQDDFYLQVVDWSALNVLAVGLGACVYLWSACTSKVGAPCSLGVGVFHFVSISR